MTDVQLLYILEKKYSGCQFQSISFNAWGNMITTFTDSVGDMHEESLSKDGTVTTFDH